MKCPRCDALTRFGAPCQSFAACNKHPGATQCRTHRTPDPIIKVVEKPCRPELEFLQIYGAGQAASAQMTHVTASIAQWCGDPETVRRRHTFVTFANSFERLIKTVEAALTPQNSCMPRNGLATVESTMSLFQTAGRALFDDLKQTCPRGDWTWKFRPRLTGHVELTCGGHEMPNSLRSWLSNPNDNLVEKTVFCRIPSAMAGVMASVGDMAAKVWAPGGLATKMAGRLIDPGADRMFRAGQELANGFRVYVVTGPFVAVARQSQEDEKKPAWWRRIGAGVAASIGRMTGILIAGARATIQCLMAAGQSTVYVARLLMNLVREHFANMVMLMAAGTAARALWAPMAMLIAHGSMLAQLLLDPMAWIGASAVIAAHATQLIGVDYGVSLYRMLVSIFPAISQIITTHGKLIGWIGRQGLAVPPMPTTAVTALTVIGERMFTCSAPGFTMVDLQKLVAQGNWNVLASAIDLTAIGAAVQKAPEPMVVGAQVPTEVFETSIATVALANISNSSLAVALESLGPVAHSAGQWVSVLGPLVSMSSIALCLATVGTWTGGLACLPVIARYLVAYKSQLAVDLLQQLGVPISVSSQLIQAARTANAVVSAASVWTWWSAPRDMAIAISDIGAHAGAVAAVADRADTLTAINEGARGMRLTAMVAHCVFDIIAAAGQLVQEGAFFTPRDDPRIVACLREIFNVNAADL